MDTQTTSPTDLGNFTRTLELDSLRLLSVVCREGSYARAAGVEPLTASAISKRIIELERAMGCVLLQRTRRGVRPTLVGELVLAQWCEVEARLRELMTAPERVASLNPPTVVVGDAAAAQFMQLDCLPHAGALEHEPDVQVVPTETSQLAAAFESHRAGAAIWCPDAMGMPVTAAATELPGLLMRQRSQVTRYRFKAEVCVAVLRRDHPLADQTRLRAQDLRQFHTVCAAGTHARIAATLLGPTQGQHGEQCEPRLQSPAWARLVSSTLDCLERVPHTLVAVLPVSARHSVHRYPSLQCVPLDASLGWRHFACLLRNDARRAECRDLLEHVLGAVLELDPWQGDEAPAAVAPAQSFDLPGHPARHAQPQGTRPAQAA